MSYVNTNDINKYPDLSDVQSKMEEINEYIDIYPTAKNADLQKSLDKSLNNFKSKLKIFDEIHVMWGYARKRREGVIAEYYHSTSLNSCPIIILYENTISDELEYELKHYGSNDIDHVIGVTVFHELCHAIVDIDNYYIFGEDNILKFTDEEEYVENFARDFYDNMIIPNEIIKLSKLFKNKQWIDIDVDYEINY